MPIPQGVQAYQIRREFGGQKPLLGQVLSARASGWLDRAVDVEPTAVAVVVASPYTTG